MAGTKPAFYITTAISYVNGSPHLGHAYEGILTDVMARFKRLDGHEVFFLTGTDEHGQKVAKTAEKNGMAPKAFCDKIAAEFVQQTKDLNISNDDFIRTTEPRHYKASQGIWNAIGKNNPEDIYLGHYNGWYSVRDEGYFTESELTEAPDGTKLAPSGAPVEWVEEPSYFFRLSAYTEKLLQLYADRPEFIEPESRRNEVISFVKKGLQDVSISRTNFKWGVPVPGDPDHVMYVWLDALTNYITGVGYPDTDSDSYRTFWPADFHVIGKDIIRFHCVYWPAFLMAAGLELPKCVFAHGFINVEGQKMSKSVGNVISPSYLVDTFGLDQMRYLLMREVPHGQDGNFSEAHAIERINSDLANGLGNLAQRSLSMIAKNCEGKVPAHGDFTPEDRALMTHAHEEMMPQIREEFSAFRFNRGLEKIWKLVDAANAYIDEQAPWALKKTDTNRMGTVLYVLAETIRCLAIAVQPVVPGSAAKMLDQLAVPEDARDYAHISAGHMLKSGTSLPAPEGVFPRIQIEEAAE
ncbi:MAG: methionine--tRNA ligase [Rhodospirillales bacterium]|nr:methionine--tRNA ligase [Alphaproteobacteria bacterium]USO03355.1 MAG: methionine--tRNA ligase [Rhodospirillales bacterium]